MKRRGFIPCPGENGRGGRPMHAGMLEMGDGATRSEHRRSPRACGWSGGVGYWRRIWSRFAPGSRPSTECPLPGVPVPRGPACGGYAPECCQEPVGAGCRDGVGSLQAQAAIGHQIGPDRHRLCIASTPRSGRRWMRHRPPNWCRSVAGASALHVLSPELDKAVIAIVAPRQETVAIGGSAPVAEKNHPWADKGHAQKHGHQAARRLDVTTLPVELVAFRVPEDGLGPEACAAGMPGMVVGCRVERRQGWRGFVAPAGEQHVDEVEGSFLGTLPVAATEPPARPGGQVSGRGVGATAGRAALVGLQLDPPVSTVDAAVAMAGDGATPGVDKHGDGVVGRRQLLHPAHRGEVWVGTVAAAGQLVRGQVHRPGVAGREWRTADGAAGKAARTQHQGRPGTRAMPKGVGGCQRPPGLQPGWDTLQQPADAPNQVVALAGRSAERTSVVATRWLAPPARASHRRAALPRCGLQTSMPTAAKGSLNRQGRRQVLVPISRIGVRLLHAVANPTGPWSPTQRGDHRGSKNDRG